MDNFNENVMYLEDEDFDANGKLLKPHDKPVVVMIMASWCGYCKKMKPEFQKFADMVNNKDCYCAVIQSDGATDGEKALGKRAGSFIPGFRGFPTIVKFKDGKYVGTMDGERTVEGLKKFVKN
jgi:thiol-disulfide isomerase/thioredoxin